METSETKRTPLEPHLVLAQAMIEQYRFPPGFLKFCVGGALSSEAHFFRFGPATCFGRTVNHDSHHRLDCSELDLLPLVASEGARLSLPFNPTEVIDNLRLERYTNGPFRPYESLLKSLYYQLRPFTNRALRKYVQRFRASGAPKQQFPNWPVDTTVENLCEALIILSLKANQIERIPFIWFWPRRARACVMMTHDVETEAGRTFCEQLLEINERYGIRASFQIVPEKRYRVTEEFLDLLRDRGCEVCVQDLNHDGRLFDQWDEFQRRVSLINKHGRRYRAKGFRSAVLYRKPEWYGDFEFSYDMSIPNVANLDPQRGGCCTVMPYFIGGVLELPLTTVQDYTLFHILKEYSIDLWKTQVESVLAKNGLVSFIVHPDYILEPKALAAYKDLLGMLTDLRQRENLWFALPGDIDLWWRARSQMSIAKHGETWKIIGDEADQAALAFAEIRNGKLFYEVPDVPQSGIASSAEEEKLSR